MATNRTSRIAREILSEKALGTCFPVAVADLAVNERVVIKPLTTERRFEGRLEMCAGKPTIFVNDHGRGLDYPRVRFTLAHEFAHFFLHRRWLTSGGAFHDAELLSGDNLRAIEREANGFAAECLLPERLVDRFLGRGFLSLGRIEQLADEARASLKATAIRVAGLATARCCVFLEKGGTIQWAAPSDDWCEARFVWSGWKGHLPHGSHVSTDPGTFEEREVPLQAWCPNSRARDEPLFESALHTRYGRLVLVVDGSTEGFIS